MTARRYLADHGLLIGLFLLAQASRPPTCPGCSTRGLPAKTAGATPTPPASGCTCAGNCAAK